MSGIVSGASVKHRAVPQGSTVCSIVRQLAVFAFLIFVTNLFPQGITHISTRKMKANPSDATITLNEVEARYEMRGVTASVHGPDHKWH